jgi:hypothetical protein
MKVDEMMERGGVIERGGVMETGTCNGERGGAMETGVCGGEMGGAMAEGVCGEEMGGAMDSHSTTGHIDTWTRSRGARGARTSCRGSAARVRVRLGCCSSVTPASSERRAAAPLTRLQSAQQSAASRGTTSRRAPKSWTFHTGLLNGLGCRLASCKIGNLERLYLSCLWTVPI